MEVVDGDTIVVEIGGQEYRVRYIGIDTPETHHPTDGADWLGFEASEANASMVKVGETVILEKDISETDIYDRLLRYVWAGDTFVNAELVRMGLARVLFYDPDVKYKSLLLQLYDEAAAKKIGIHGPKPTPPAVKPVRYRGIVWTTAPDPDTKSVALRYDPARGEPIMAFPVGLQTRLVDAFWVPEDGRWWYWIGVNGFNGWTTGEYITIEKPAAVFPGPEYPFEGYEILHTRADSGQVPVHSLPGGESAIVGHLDPRSEVQVRRLSWEESTGEWWYFVDTPWVDGWVSPEHLVYENP